MKRTDTLSAYVRRIILCSVLFWSMPGPEAAIAAELTTSFGIQNFSWKEFDASGRRLVKESGPLFSVGVAYDTELENNLTFRPAAELFGGRVDYEGLAWDPLSPVPVYQPASSDTNYVGLTLQGDLGRRLGGSGSYGEPFAGLGLRAWVRDIESGMAADGTATAGYVEQWFTLNLRLGIRGAKQMARNKQVSASAGFKLPLYTQTTAYLSDVGYSDDTTVNPGRKTSFFAEAGFRVNRFNIGLWYDSLRFSASDHDLVVYLPNGSVSAFLQPKSRMDLYGVRISYVF